MKKVVDKNSKRRYSKFTGNVNCVHEECEQKERLL